MGLFLVFLASAARYDSGRTDFYYLADAFLHGRTWITTQLGEWDVVIRGDEIYLPFAPFPAIVVLPFVAALGPAAAGTLDPVINASLATTSSAMAIALARRLGVQNRSDRLWLGIGLVGLSTPIWWLTTRGGVWHTGQLVATALVFAGLLEAYGECRSGRLGVLGAASFLSRPTLVGAFPLYLFRVLKSSRRHRRVLVAVAAWLVALSALLTYNTIRFGNALESGYGLARLPEFLERQRERGVFGIAHLPMNIDYMMFHLPAISLEAPFLTPDGLGMSILLTSPGLLLALRARAQRADVRWLWGSAALVIAPNLLYYGGGWIQYGYRYGMDAIPFVYAIVCLSVAEKPLSNGGKMLIVIGLIVNAIGLYWAYHLVAAPTSA